MRKSVEIEILLQFHFSFRVCQVCPENHYVLSSNPNHSCQKCLKNVICSGGKAWIPFGYFAFINNQHMLSKAYLCPLGYCCQKNQCFIDEDNHDVCAEGLNRILILCDLPHKQKNDHDIS